PCTTGGRTRVGPPALAGRNRPRGQETRTGNTPKPRSCVEKPPESSLWPWWAWKTEENIISGAAHATTSLPRPFHLRPNPRAPPPRPPRSRHLQEPDVRQRPRRARRPLRRTPPPPPHTTHAGHTP